MSKFHRAILALAVAASLAAPAHARSTCYFGECGNTPAPQERESAPAPRERNAQGGKIGWQVVTGDQGQRILLDRFDNGSTLMLAKNQGNFRLGLTHPEWHFRKGQKVRASVTINGHAFNGEATAVSNDMVIIDKVSEEVIDTMFKSDAATVQIADYRWDLNMNMARGALEQASNNE